jgi:hypothetical protein
MEHGTSKARLARVLRERGKTFREIRKSSAFPQERRTPMPEGETRKAGNPSLSFASLVFAEGNLPVDFPDVLVALPGGAGSFAPEWAFGIGHFRRS